MGRPILSFLTTALILAALFLLAIQLDLIPLVREGFNKNPLWGASLYVFLLVLGTVISPVTTLPIVPFVASVFGPFETAVLSVFGWTLGAAAVFGVVKFGFLPFIIRFVSGNRLAYYEQFLPEKTRFWFLVLFRMVVPVEFSSYLIAIFTTIGFGEYLLGTAIGVLPFAFIFSYTGPAFLSDDIFQLGLLAVFAILIFSLAYFLLVRRMKK
ncbi:MAG: hypothetical protein UX94_C0004G0047 [Parcubacteria group bacterium GW2011_GWA2_47_21]|nr:MAG: hypothetical protein UX94_C0004G0047 [Parcubacteria group bacterium GW2011_GWA2_47_21]